MRKGLLLLLLLNCAITIFAKQYLFRSNTSNYKIVVAQGASQSERTAAEELQQYIKEISGIILPITDVPSDHMIHVGWTSETQEPKPEDSYQGFRYFTDNGNLYIYGGKELGTLYGVFAFLENELGVRWYTSDFTKIPKRKSYVLKKLNHSEEPRFTQRLDFYHTALADAVWCAHNKLNEQYTPHQNTYGGTTACYGIHTLFNLVPPEKHFASHPEYYSLRDGKRQHQAGQLCLSNPEVARIASQNLITVIRNNPGYWVYDVSQLDNQNYCQCAQCEAIANKYGGQSGLMIWFVNQVADEVGKVFPDKRISTFAYQYTRHAPKGIKPRKNVVMRMCNIECCFSHPLKSKDCPKNQEFMRDLEDWEKICDDIYVWDYVVNFYNYLVPFPNFAVLQGNIQTFSENHVIGILEEGAHNAQWAEFSELRQWIIAKLLWNPEQDVNALVKEFIKDYYGPASTQILKYFRLSQGIPADAHLCYNTHYEHQCYDDKFTQKALPMLEKAYKAVQKDTVLRKRVNRVLAQVYYLYTCRHPEDARKDGTYQKLKTILKEDPTRITEGKNDLDTHIKKQGFT